MKTKATVIVMTLLMLVLFGQAAHAAPVQAPITGEIDRITIDNINDFWSGGKIVVGGEMVIIPRNMLIDLPANRLTLKQIFDQAPAACVTAHESGLAKGDTCNTSGAGGIATIAANITNAGNIIAGDVFIEKGIEAVTGRVTYINYTDGYFRVNGIALNNTQVDDNTGVMVRLNDPTSRHTVQQGLGCLAGSLNCSPDPRFTLDPDNYVITYTTGYPVCVPSMVSRTFTDSLVPPLGVTTAQSLANGTGDVLCPSTNRTISNGQPVDDSRRFAPIQLGDNVTAEGNYETINCVRFVSVHTMNVAAALTTKNIPGQPDYMFLEEVFIDAPGFQNKRARSLFIGYTTLAPADVMIWSLHRDPTTNQAHEFPLGTTAGCDAAAGPLTCTGQGIIPGGGDIFRIRHDVDFLVGAKDKLNPCMHLRGDPRMGSNFCPVGALGGIPGLELAIPEMFGILSPIPHEIQARTGKKFADPSLKTLDINGNVATNGQYLFPFGIGLGGIDIPNFFEINIGLIQTPYNFSGIPWNLDRRLSPGGCSDPVSGCGTGPFALDPFPFEGLAMDPRLQEPNLPNASYTDRNFTQSDLNLVPYGVRNRILSFVSGTTFGGLYNFDGNNTVLAWPPADPAFITLPVLPPVAPNVPPVTAITSFPVFSATRGQLYSYQVIATNPSPVCGGLTYSLTLNPAGMSIDATGLIQWVPSLGQLGNNAVTVRVTDANGFFDTQSFGIVVAPQGAVKIGIYSDGLWYLDNNGSGAWEGIPADTLNTFGSGLLAPIAVTGDWTGTGVIRIGVYDSGIWYLDINGNRTWDGTPTDAIFTFGVGLPAAIPVTGDWTGTGITRIGVYDGGTWYLDIDGNGAWDGTPTDAIYTFGTGMPAAIPVTGNWTATAITRIGVYDGGTWYLDMDGNGAWDGTPTDAVYSFGVGLPGEKPVTGDWDATGTTKIGIYDGTNWYLDASGNGAWDGIPADAIFTFGGGLPNAQPVSGRW